MELSLLSVILWLILLVQTGHAQERPKASLILAPTEQIFSGETVTLTCDIKGHTDTEWRYSWYKADDKDDPVYYSEGKNEYSLSVVESDSGEYTCIGERRRDSQRSEISDAVTLTVSAEAQAVLSVSPQNWLTEGDSVNLSCEVRDSSTGWNFSWYKAVSYRHGLTQIRDSAGYLMYNVELLSDSSRGSGGSYTLSSAALNNTGVYLCRAERGEPAYHTQYSNPQPLWMTDGSVILESSVHPVTEGDPLTLHCLYLNAKSSDLTADFYKDGLLLQTQTTGEMIIPTVSKFCLVVSGGSGVKHAVGVSVGVSLTLLFLILLTLRWCYKNKKGKTQNTNQTQSDQNRRGSGAEDSQDGYTPLQAASVDVTMDATYSKIDLKAKKKPKDKQVTDPESDDVTYAEIDLKIKKKPRRNQETSMDSDTVYSELKPSTSKGP
ncbi:uncharacterized protein LOC111197681 [Astyanax mexicanus]|uniref:uncharacterized protein LOC111197681 n=1 Tax=Astyanax mexicanus TaxID=7994 RepID=UPI0020CB0D4E|nr:uncharacterized protein LOC111197681 [Astyanax mexicanus]